MSLGKIVNAEATVEPGELTMFVETLQLLGIEHTVEPCYLDEFKPEEYGYKFLPPADGIAVKVRNTIFVFSKGAPFHLNTKQFGPCGTFVLTQDETGKIQFRTRYENGEQKPEYGFEALDAQYGILPQVHSFQEHIESIKQQQADIEALETDYCDFNGK